MKLSSRYAVDVVTVVGGAFLVVAAMSFSPSVAGWLGFGVSTGLTVIAALSAGLGRPIAQRIGQAAIAVVGLWSLIAALVFSGSLLMWLVFADGIALVIVALADLTAHEVSTERVVHQLVLRPEASLNCNAATPARREMEQLAG